MKFLRKNIENWRNWKTQFFWVGHFGFVFSKKNLFCFIPMKISQSVLSSKDGSKFWWLSWFPAQNNSCINICNTVYISFLFGHSTNLHNRLKFFLRRTHLNIWTPLLSRDVIYTTAYTYNVVLAVRVCSCRRFVLVLLTAKLCSSALQIFTS